MRFNNLQQLVRICEEENKSISQVMLEDQALETGISTDEVFRQMAEYYDVMKEAVSKGLTGDTKSRSGLTGGDAKKVADYMQRGETLLGGPAAQAMAYALAVSEVNASMGRIIATPTAGSCGIIPGVFVSAQERFGWDDERLVHGLFSAGAIGYVIANNASISGAEEDAKLRLDQLSAWRQVPWSSCREERRSKPFTRLA
ncbi:L-serine dehydratase [Paenibacillus pini JCM 16418]|uniref:L-serine ammonia-lyase n=1 Tax=Paenibacillus pini JCM 16418 TaxID=1236976 RepID=W7Y7G5_9BACL|nr:L-serine dehydratase [Paenibacillus pini JCM 16418]